MSSIRDSADSFYPKQVGFGFVFGLYQEISIHRPTYCRLTLQLLIRYYKSPLNSIRFAIISVSKLRVYTDIYGHNVEK